MMPRARLIFAVLVLVVPFACAPFSETAASIGSVGLVVLTCCAVFDAWRGPSIARISVGRETRPVMSVGARNAVRIRLTNRSERSCTLFVHDEPPLPSTWEDLPFRVTLPPGRTRTITYHLIPRRRGTGRFGDIYLRSISPWGLWTFADRRDAAATVSLYPDIESVRSVELLARRNRMAESGIRTSILRGRGSDFERLREYRREDEYRDIDWKATARHRELISKEYIVEQNQHIVLVLDSGRSMCNSHEGISHFDRVLNAAVLLASVSLRQGDTVGLLAFDKQVRTWIPAVRGTRSVDAIVRRTYDLWPSYTATDYAALARELRRRVRKRSLIVFLTHAIDELNLAEIERHVGLLRGPHLVLIAFVKNVELTRELQHVPQNDLQAFQIAAAAELAEEISVTLARLGRRRTLVLEAAPDQLAAPLISRYLDIKARHLL